VGAAKISGFDWIELIGRLFAIKPNPLTSGGIYEKEFQEGADMRPPGKLLPSLWRLPY